MVEASLRATILESIYNFKNNQNISVLYITHDLTTAHQLCDDIMILYKGNMVEAGPFDSVVRKPAHVYTKHLVGSIPFPDPKMKWKKYNELCKLIDFIVAPREKETKEGNFKYIEADKMQVSSSEIRKSIQFKKDWSNLVPETVKEYIVKNNLYQ